MDSVFAQEVNSETNTKVLHKEWHMVIEGANAAMLDLNLGSYPYCTSSDCLVSGVGGGLSIPPRSISSIVGVTKAYCTRVGEGPFPTELFDEIGRFLQDKGHEYGASTGRLRRCGWLDIPMIRYTHAVNGFDCLMLTKLDVLSGLEKIRVAVAYVDKHGRQLPDRYFPADLQELGTFTCEYRSFAGWSADISGCRSFSDLPHEAQTYVSEVEAMLGVPIKFIGVGARRDAIISRE
eukprot:Gregarina_sp_Poly_1__8670@NODE_516_length_7810_cov_96_902622_g410_i0_p5_GENE_NODE_516_length_7810_cov_96_902622_g410_i0NODE_516_length_7810_cov_96_902622_g410_i0_p5_ORF_typecomplete_len235_score21_88Adenylsucc_synt/PF00709_21/3_5e82_NODE_516_length_7810_cov_96_902622_g410_i050205724